MSSRVIALLLLLGMIIAGSKMSNGSLEVVRDHSHNDGNFSHDEFESNHRENALDQCGGHLDIRQGWYHYHESPKC